MKYQYFLATNHTGERGKGIKVLLTILDEGWEIKSAVATADTVHYILAKASD